MGMFNLWLKVTPVLQFKMLFLVPPVMYFMFLSSLHTAAFSLEF